MKVRCKFCGALHDWFAMPMLTNGHDLSLLPPGHEQRNNEHGGTICMPAGVVFAARHIQHALPRAVQFNGEV